LQPWIVLDLETTGLDQISDQIIECAAFAVDPSTLEVVDAFHQLVKPVGFGKMPDPFVLRMHAVNGLWADLASPMSNVCEVGELDERLSAWLAQFGSRLSLAGNSVHFDLGFLRNQTPKSAKCLSHRVIDVTSMHLAAQAWGKPTPSNTSSETHRAKDDALWSLETLRHYRKAG
jgi:oligoribonuclease (3'-5' exoribonuclease)